MDLPDILGEDDSSSTEQRSRSLYFLGRRLERLFLVGVLLVVLSFFSVLLTTASKQLTSDNVLDSVVALQDSIAKNKEHLTELFDHRNDAPPRTVAPQTLERLKELSQTRRQLGLPDQPPPGPPQPSLPKPQEKYFDALNKLVQDAISHSKLRDSDLISKLLDSNASPENLEKMLATRRESIESKPASFWGIETPRTLRLQYADQSYIVPYLVMSILVVASQAFLILGWLTAVYMTRQRELVTIVNLRDYKQAFPHILNVLPVDLSRFITRKKRGMKTDFRPYRIFLFLVRAAVILLFSVPMIFGFTYSLVMLLDISGAVQSFFWLFLGWAATTVMALQVVGLLVQDGVLLRGKLFVE